MKVLCVGYGNMGRALLQGWRAPESETKSQRHQVSIDWFVLESHPEAAARARADGLTLLSEAEIENATEFDGVLLAVKPQQAFDLKSLGLTAHWVMSIMAGVPTQSIRKIINSQQIIRVMPNTPAMIGMGVSGVYFDNCSVSLCELVKNLLTKIGTVVEVPQEEMINAVTAISGSGPGYLMEFAAALIEAAVSMGFKQEDAKAMTGMLIQGSGAWLLGSTFSADTLRDQVTSKGGTTAAGLAVFRENNLRQTVVTAAQAALDRARELANATESAS